MYLREQKQEHFFDRNENKQTILSDDENKKISSQTTTQIHKVITRGAESTRVRQRALGENFRIWGNFWKTVASEAVFLKIIAFGEVSREYQV